MRGFVDRFILLFKTRSLISGSTWLKPSHCSHLQTARQQLLSRQSRA